MKQRKKRIK